MSSLTRSTGLSGLSGLTGQGVDNTYAGQGVKNPLADLIYEEMHVPLDKELMKSLESQ